MFQLGSLLKPVKAIRDALPGGKKDPEPEPRPAKKKVWLVPRDEDATPEEA